MHEVTTTEAVICLVFILGTLAVWAMGFALCRAARTGDNLMALFPKKPDAPEAMALQDGYSAGSHADDTP